MRGRPVDRSPLVQLGEQHEVVSAPMISMNQDRMLKYKHMSLKSFSRPTNAVLLLPLQELRA